jgi:hypothetical protein
MGFVKIIVPIVIACIAFFTGFLVGNKKEKPISYKFEKKNNEDFRRLQKEYENFLTYDGSVQE